MRNGSGPAKDASFPVLLMPAVAHSGRSPTSVAVGSHGGLDIGEKIAKAKAQAGPRAEFNAWFFHGLRHSVWFVPCDQAFLLHVITFMLLSCFL